MCTNPKISISSMWPKDGLRCQCRPSDKQILSIDSFLFRNLLSYQSHQSRDVQPMLQQICNQVHEPNPRPQNGMHVPSMKYKHIKNSSTLFTNTTKSSLDAQNSTVYSNKSTIYLTKHLLRYYLN